MRVLSPWMLMASLLLMPVVWAQVASPSPEAPSIPATSPSTTAATQDIAVPEPPPVPLLWKISDADNAVYVLGSFHLLKPEDYPLSKDVEAAFADAEKLMFELSPEEMSSPVLGMQMGQAAMRTDGTRLDSDLSPEIAAQLQAWLARNETALQASGIQGPSLQMFEPWFVGLTVSITEMTKLGLNPALGLDAHFSAKAKEAKKRATGLETGAQQIAFLDGMSKQEQVQMLAEALEESAEGPAEMERLHRQWREGDEQGILDGMVAEMKRDYPSLYQRINVARNDAWVPVLEKQLKASKDDTLVVVGALHALGEDGIVHKLAARGYTVERICSACAVEPPVEKNAPIP